MKNYRFLFLAVAIMVIALFITAAAAQEKVVITVMTKANELSEETIAAFEEANPDIDIVLIDEMSNSLRDFEIALASDNPPDIMRMTGALIEGMYNRGMLLDITDYLTTSEMIDLDDLASGISFYIFDDHYYGLPKDWSVNMLFINTQMFEAAGIPLPSAEEPLTYAEIADLAAQLTIYDENGELVQMGLGGGFSDTSLAAILMQQKATMFNEDNTAVNFTNNPAVAAVMRYYFDLQLAGQAYSVLQPEDSWLAFPDGYTAIHSSGYWYQATITEDKPTFGHVMALPIPIWDRNMPRINPTTGPTGLGIFIGTEHPDEAFRFLEYYTAGEPAVARAQSGWGLPILHSLESELPVETDFQKQVLEVAQAGMKYTVPLPSIPYSTFSAIFSASWDRNLQQAAAGEITFEELLVNMEQEINLAILDEMMAKD